jgi:putative hydrolase of the HAD superfamily
MIKIIIIDLGGVYFKAGTKIALPKICKLVNVSKQRADEIFEGYPKKEGWLYRRGKITKEKFWKAAVRKLKINEKLVPKLQKIWHSSYKPTAGMKKLVAQLRRNYRVIVFSGNIKERIEYLNKKYDFKKDFDDFVFSFDAGFSKTEIGFYKVLLKRINCEPKECIFIDDLQEFLDTARSFGFKTILFKNSKQLKSNLRKFGVKI